MSATLASLIVVCCLPSTGLAQSSSPPPAVQPKSAGKRSSLPRPQRVSFWRMELP
jgi:hypothetical protein